MGAYELLGLIGSGGMGEVYRARDTRLDRYVAIKVLPTAVSGDPRRRRRFEQEARAIAALSHPHICTLHDGGSQDDTPYIVMELLDGETLTRRIARRPLPVAEAIAIALQIARALAAAHAARIIHRDLKPGNVMLTRTGTKLLDFGLAELGAVAVPGDEVTTATDMPLPAKVIGTLAYMAPEQVQGRPVDARTDLFAFGVVVYEMITGRRPFAGENQAALIGSILHASPAPLREAAPDVPPSLERLASTCLAKEPAQRWACAHDVVLQLEQLAESAATEPPGSAAPGPLGRLGWGALTAASLATIAVAALLATDRPAAMDGAGRQVFSLVPPPGSNLASGEAPQISPDGRRVAFVATDDAGGQRIYLRDLDTTDARPLPGTEAASLLFWAPDSARLGFFAGDRLKTVSIAGGSPVDLATAPVPRGGSWGRDDTIVFVASPALPVMRVGASGGAASPLPRGEDPFVRWFPSLLPDGRHYLLVLADPRDRTRASLHVASLDSSETTELLGTDMSVSFAGGHLLYRRERALVAQPFDPVAMRLEGSPITISEEMGFNAITRQALFSVSETGSLVYQDARVSSRLTWVDRQGRFQAALPAHGEYGTLCLSSDGQRLVYDLADPSAATVDVWSADLDGRNPLRLTFDEVTDFYPVCSPVDSGVAFASLRGGPPNLHVLDSAAPGTQRPLLPQGSAPRVPTDWGAGGGRLLYSELHPETGWDLMLLELPDGEPSVLVGTPAVEGNGKLSPDGGWFAYVSNETGGTYQVYVEPMPQTGARWQVSLGGGHQPSWSPDATELYYVTPNRRLVAVRVRASGAAFSWGEARTVTEARFTTFDAAQRRNAQYAVTPDGERIVMAVEGDVPRSITILRNWALPSR
jgi:Tol biopolymer transport system component